MIATAIATPALIHGGIAQAKGAVDVPPPLQPLPRRSGVRPTTDTCDPCVTMWQKTTKTTTKSRQHRLVYLLGTTHISQPSAILAESLVRTIRPNAVFLELDLKRVTVLEPLVDGTNRLPVNGPEATPIPSLQLVIPSLPLQRSDERVPLWAAIALAKSLEDNYSKYGIVQGAEFANAARAGRDVGAAIVLGDQDCQLTKRRLAHALGVTSLFQARAVSQDIVVYPILGRAKVKRDLLEYAERIKTRDAARNMRSNDMRAPALFQALYTERETYMAAGIDTLNQYKSMVAVMGIAHLDGVEQNLRDRGWKQVQLQCPEY